MSGTSFESGIYSLPHEVLNRIVKYLDLESKLRLSWTCTLFHSVTRIPSLWFDFKWVSNGECRNLRSMEVALRNNGISVKKLSLIYCSEENPMLLRIFPVINSCQYLQSLSLTNLYFEQRDLLPLLDQVPTLTELNIHSLSHSIIQIPPLGQRNDLKILSIFNMPPSKPGLSHYTFLQMLE